VADRVTGGIAQWASARQVTSLTMSASSLGLAVIAGAWYTDPSLQAQATGLFFLVACVLAAQVARVMARQQPAAEWGGAACATLCEAASYAGLAAGVSLARGSSGLTGLAGTPLRGGLVDRIGGHGASGVWALAVAAAIVLALHHVASLCVAGPSARALQASGARLLAAGLADLLAGPRAAIGAALVLGLLSLLYLLARPGDTVAREAGGVAGYRGDGPLSAWIGGFVEGRLPPAPPLVVGLLVTCMLSALGLRNLPGILVLAPAEAMLLAALGSSHLHDGPGDWRVPPLLQAGEYVFLGAAGYAGHVPAVVTFGLIVAAGLRHLDMAYRARNRVPLSWFTDREPARLPRADWRGFGWEGRMILAAIALLGGVAPAVYLAMALYLGALEAADYLASWTNARLPTAPAPSATVETDMLKRNQGV
jgi:hypothetical protein